MLMCFKINKVESIDMKCETKGHKETKSLAKIGVKSLYSGGV